MALTDIIAKNAKPKEKLYKLSDEKGLRLVINVNGGKYWQLKYRYLGKEKTLSFGTYPDISLKEAREKRDIARKKISDGIDPSEEKKIEKVQKHLNLENSFKNIALEWHQKNLGKWKERHGKYILKRLEADIFPEIGHRPINQINAPELLSLLHKIEKRGAFDIAKRALQTSGQIFRFAIATGRAERDISADLKGALTVRKSKHHNRLEESELPEFLEKLEKYDGEILTKLALKFLINTFVRTIELRGAKWDEINFNDKEWHIPAERMKMGYKHIVPLSRQSLEILEEIKKINNNSDFIFPSQKNKNKQMSENTMLFAMYRMGYHSRATPHGFRATISTILNEKGFNRDHIERQLAHGERDKVRATYNHAQYLEDRHKMMGWWSDYLENKGMKFE
jgi:integrase